MPISDGVSSLAVSSGEGYSAGLLLVEEGGAMSIMAQRSGDDTAWGGITYLCA